MNMLALEHGGYPLPVTRELIEVLEEESERRIFDPTKTGIIFSFKDPAYTAETGGFHPVEIALGSNLRLLYITDFAYYGQPPFAELEKEIDFDFSGWTLNHRGEEYPIEEQAELYEAWQSNFIAYYRMGVYDASVSELY